MYFEEYNLSVAEKANEILYNLSSGLIRTDNFEYLAEAIAYEEEQMNPETKSSLDIKIVTIDSEEFYLLINKILKSNNSDSIKKIFIILLFTFIETIEMQINNALLDEIDNDDEVADILFGGYYNLKINELLNEINPKQVAINTFTDMYYLFFKEYKEDLINLRDSLDNCNGFSGDFIGWNGKEKFLNALDNIDLNNIENLISNLSYYKMLYLADGA